MSAVKHKRGCTSSLRPFIKKGVRGCITDTYRREVSTPL